jgi:hypothetical protein
LVENSVDLTVATKAVLRDLQMEMMKAVPRVDMLVLQMVFLKVFVMVALKVVLMGKTKEPKLVFLSVVWSAEKLAY